MRRTSNLIFIFGGVLICICLAASAFILFGSQLGIDQVLGSNPETARQIANSMLGYSLPAGYHAQGGRDIGILKMVVITPDGGEPEYLSKNIILVSTYPKIFGLSEEQFQRELRMALLRSAADVLTMEYIREETSMVQGQEIMLKTYESFGEYDPPTRIIFSSVFPSKEDDILLVFAGPIATWDQKMVDQFIQSIE